jgi:hypothetical protein
MFMNTLTRERVVPIISASVSWLIFPMTGSVLPSLPKFAISRSPRQPLFTWVEELVDQVLLDPRVPSQEEGHKHLREFRLLLEHAHDCRLFESRDDAVHHRRSCGQAQWLTGQAPLAEKVALAVERDDRLLASRG